MFQEAEGAHLKFERMHPLGPGQNIFLLLVYVLLAVMISLYAGKRKRLPVNWYLLSIVFTPVAAGIVLKMIPKGHSLPEENWFLKIGFALTVTLVLVLLVMMLDFAP